MSQVAAQNLATHVQQLQREVAALELERKRNAAQVQAMSEYIGKSCWSASSPQPRDTAANKQGYPAFGASAVRARLIQMHGSMSA